MDRLDRLDGPDPAQGVYGISVAAELAGTGVQNLRAYEARGLLTPERTQGGTRRYSSNDIDRLRRIGQLLGAGLNLAGIAMVIDLQDENARLRSDHKPQREGGPAMTTNRAHPADNLRLPTGDSQLLGASEPVPEADRLEQLTPLNSGADPGLAPAADGPTSTVGRSAHEPTGPVDEADWLEQQLTVPAAECDDEDYPPDQTSPSSPISP